MERLTIQVGGFEVNCSILSGNGKAWIVDPGQEPERIIDTLAKKGLEPAAILLTHAHFDHIGAIPGLTEKFPGLPVYVHEKDAPMIGHPLNQLPPEYTSFAKPKNLKGLEGLEGLGSLEVIETPGHTPGGVCYYFPNFQTSQTSKPLHLLLSGDTLFAGSVGRTDLPGGDMATLMDSLQKLVALPDDTLVIPGHGPHTTIAAEKRGNPFLQ
ncbi:MAG: MBL fold metallo-hydrolase [bacterium]|nr:MBL fold metallo-hydrolase [Candidatus Colisoma equi]